jgi:hypothetical protein
MSRSVHVQLGQLASDRRGVAAMEFGILSAVIILLLLPIADVAAAAITYIRAYQAMRNVAAWTQYNPPPDLTTPATWPRLANIPVMSGFVVTPQASTGAPPQPSTPGGTVNIYITALCGDPPGAACSAAAAQTPTTPKWFYLSASVKMNPIFLNLPVLKGGTISHSVRFQ